MKTWQQEWQQERNKVVKEAFDQTVPFAFIVHKWTYLLRVPKGSNF